MIDLVAPVLVSVVISKVFLDWWVSTAPRLGFVGRDMNKPGNVIVPEAGGIWVLFSSVIGLLTYIAIERYTDNRVDVVSMLSIVIVLLMAGLIGFLDDVLGWKKGIRPITRVLLTFPISIPLIVVKAGTSVIELPIIGVLDLGPLYTFLVIPIGVLGASNAFNMLAGYNGLEALQAVILLVSTIILAYLTNRVGVVYVVAPVLASVLVFLLLYNKYPARCFPGNTFTYGFGAFYASIAIYWNFEKYAILSYTLYFIELILFLRGLVNGVYKENFARVGEDGYLEPPYNKSYSLTHVAIRVVKRIKGKCKEPDVVVFIAIIQALVCIVSLLLVTLKI